MEVAVTTGAISRAKLQPNHHHQQTNTQFFTGRMPFLSPTNSVKALKGKISNSMDLLTPSNINNSNNQISTAPYASYRGSRGGLPTLSLTTNSSWLPWGRVAMPLISLWCQYPTHTVSYQMKSWNGISVKLHTPDGPQCDDIQSNFHISIDLHLHRVHILVSYWF